MLSAFVNSMKIPELRARIIFTFFIIFLCRILAAIPAPGVNPAAVKDMLNNANTGGDGGFLGIFNLFTGGALEQFAIGSLGIMPYISASIILQLMTAVVPTLQKLQREGEVGRQKITQYTKWLTLLLCVVQGWMLIAAFSNPATLGLDKPVVPDSFALKALAVLAITTASMLLYWMGEQITEKGIGNGVSLIITISIISQLPMAVSVLWQMFTGGTGDFTIFHMVTLVLFFLAVTAGTVMLTQGVRKVAITHAKRVVGRKVYGGQTNYFPLRVNYSGVMPIIFAQAILMFPAPLLERVIGTPWARTVASWFGMNHPFYMFIYIVLLMFFSYFWVATQFNPIQIADQLKKDGGYIPGIRPGKSTAEFLDRTMTRLTLAGSVGLTILAILPMILNNRFNIPFVVAQFFGGTSLLIIVGVMLDTMRQIETHLLNRHYDGFLNKGKLRSGR